MGLERQPLQILELLEEKRASNMLYLKGVQSEKLANDEIIDKNC